ncbi:MAG: hypothetical protein WBP12_01405 [Candidatus Saccharimonas sp.]
MSEYTPELERLLEDEVLAKYDLPDGSTSWYAHDTVGPDDVVHYFSRNGQKYALVWNDFPNATFIHDEGLPPVHVRTGDNERLHIENGDLAGHYSLYQDR